MTPTFVPGLELAREFYAEVVRPLLEAGAAGLRYSAALLGPGSEVLGFDSARSTDHDWGPRLQVFLGDADASAAASVRELLGARLPGTFRGYPTRFALTGEPPGAARSQVRVLPLGQWLRERLGFDPRARIATADWLATPAQRLAEVTGGAVFHDGLGGLGRPDRLAWYPRDIWCYVLACQWSRISEEEPFTGRCGEAGDELGSAVVAGRLARDLMRLCLLMDRCYPPYSKWLGTAFARSVAGATVGPPLAAALSAADWRTRQQQLGRALTAAARAHNELALTEPLATQVGPFYRRPYLVLGGGRFADALRAAIADPILRALPLTGAVDQWVDSTAAAGDIPFLRAVTVARLGGSAPPAAGSWAGSWIAVTARAPLRWVSCAVTRSPTLIPLTWVTRPVTRVAEVISPVVLRAPPPIVIDVLLTALTRPASMICRLPFPIPAGSPVGAPRLPGPPTLGEAAGDEAGGAAVPCAMNSATAAPAAAASTATAARRPPRRAGRGSPPPGGPASRRSGRHGSPGGGPSSAGPASGPPQGRRSWSPRSAAWMSPGHASWSSGVGCHWSWFTVRPSSCPA